MSDAARPSFRRAARRDTSSPAPGLHQPPESCLHGKPPKEPMTFQPGTILIHPAHGPMFVRSITNQKFPNGDTHKCFDLESLGSYSLAISVPVGRSDDIGLRDLIAGSALDEVFDTLGSETGEEQENWSRRFKANEEKMRSGNVLSLAEVVRDVLRRNEAKPLSLGERRTLDRGMSQLAREVFYSKKLDSIEMAEQLIRDAILESRVAF